MAGNEPPKGRGLLQFVISNLDSIGSIAKLLIPATLVGALTGWAAWFAGLLQQYAPLSWVVAGLVGALIVTAILMAMSISRLWWVNTTLQKQFYQGGDKINPVETVFRNQRIKLEDLMAPTIRDLKGKTFHGCDLLGPIVLSPIGGHFDTCHWIACDHVLVRLRPGRHGMLISNSQNSYSVVDCRFLNCRFFHVTFLLPETTFPIMQNNHPNWITHTPSDPPNWPRIEPDQKKSDNKLWPA